MCDPVTLTIGALAAAGGYAASQYTSSDTPKAPDPTPTPAQPKPAPQPAPKPPAPPSQTQRGEVAQNDQMRAARDTEAKQARLAKGAGDTILTGPLGAMGQASVNRKTLLGQ